MNRIPHLLRVAEKGFAAFEAGKPRVSPYQGRDNLSRARSLHWLGGYDEAAAKRAKKISDCATEIRRNVTVIDTYGRLEEILLRHFGI